MGTLRYAVLGLLNRQDMTGYEITKAFEEALSEFWSARHSQIYPELKKLADEDLVRFETEVSGTQLERKRYRITPAGKRAFDAWERSDLALKPTPKDEFRLQLFFSDSLSKEERIELVEKRLTRHRERLEHLRHNREHYAPTSELKGAELSDCLVLIGAIRREEATCAWLEECRDIFGSQPSPAAVSLE